MPLWRHPDNPKLAELAHWLFLDKDSPWQPLHALKPLDSEQILISPLVGVAAFRELYRRELADKSPIGTQVTTGASQSISLSRLRMGFASGYKPDVDVPASGKSEPLAVCDFYACQLSRFEGAPRFELYWPETRRAAVRAELAKFLDRWGDAFRDRSRILPAFSPHLFYPPPFRLQSLAGPATPEDVVAGRAIFSLRDRPDAQVRIVSLAPYPSIARWKTLSQFPLQQPQLLQWPKNGTVDKKELDSLPHESFDREGTVWQAEEVLIGGTWHRFYGFVGSHIIAKVPAEEIEIIERFSPAHPYRG
jgi:hypothetical protein